MTAPTLTLPPDWRHHAACRGHDPELWFSLPASTEEPAALAICAQCPVTTKCAQLAADIGARDGIWGGRQHTRGGQLGTTAACAWCGNPIIRRTSNQRYCPDTACALEAERERRAARNREVTHA